MSKPVVLVVGCRARSQRLRRRGSSGATGTTSRSSDSTSRSCRSWVSPCSTRASRLGGARSTSPTPPRSQSVVTAVRRDRGPDRRTPLQPQRVPAEEPAGADAEELAEDVTLGVGALLTAVQAARPFLSAGGRITATGSMAADKPWNEAASLGVQKAGLRNLVHSIDATLEPDGIRAVSVTVRGTLGPGGRVHPGPRRRRASSRPRRRTRTAGGPRCPTRAEKVSGGRAGRPG